MSDIATVYIKSKTALVNRKLILNSGIGVKVGSYNHTEVVYGSDKHCTCKELYESRSNVNQIDKIFSEIIANLPKEPIPELHIIHSCKIIWYGKIRSINVLDDCIKINGKYLGRLPKSYKIDKDEIWNLLNKDEYTDIKESTEETKEDNEENEYELDRDTYNNLLNINYILSHLSSINRQPNGIFGKFTHNTTSAASYPNIFTDNLDYPSGNDIIADDVTLFDHNNSYDDVTPVVYTTSDDDLPELEECPSFQVNQID